MRTALLVAICLISAGLHAQSVAQSGDLDLTIRHGAPSKFVLKGCEKLAATPIDFDGTGDHYSAEWWRCGSRVPNLKTGQFPVHYVVIRPPEGKSKILPVTLSNAGDSDEYFIDELRLVSDPMSSRQLLVISGKYYTDRPQSSNCALEHIENEFECSPPSDEQYSAQEEFRPHEKSFFRKLNEYFTQ